MCCTCSRCMLPSDWSDCLAFWRRRENYPPKGHCLRILVIFEKERSQASGLYSVALWNLTDTLVSTCRHWRRCLSLRELQESYSKALEFHSARTRQTLPWPATSYLLKSPGSPILQEQDRVHHGQPLSIAILTLYFEGIADKLKTAIINMDTSYSLWCAELSH